MTPGGTRDGTLPTTTSSASAAPTERTSGSKRPATEGGGDHVAEAMQPAEGAGTTSSAGPSGEMKKGPWTVAEDAILMEYVREHGEGNWNAVQRNTGLSRCGKSCRLRWANHLRPNLKKGSFSPEEERLILQLHVQMGNKWARMAAQLPGRTDNEIKNYWNTRLKRRQRAGLPLYPPDIQRQAALHHPPTPPFFDLKAQVSAPMGNSPFNLFDRINLAGTTAAAETTRTTAVSNHLHLGHPHRPFLVPPPPAAASDHQSSVKRLRRDDVSVSLPFSTNPAPPPPPQASLFQYNRLWNYDPGPAPPLPPPPPPFTLQQRQSFYEKTELSSSQLYPELSRVAAGSDGVDNLPLERTNNDLLDALLSDSRQPVCSSSTSGWGGSGGDHSQREFLMPELVSHDVRWVKAAMGNAHVAGTEPSRCMTLEPAGRCEDSNLPIDSKVKREPTHEKMGWIEDDVSALLDAIPMAMLPMAAPPSTAAAPRDWVASDSGEGSHGQSSAVTDEVELEMQQLASSLSMAPDEDYRSWGIGPSDWDSKRPGSGIR